MLAIGTSGALRLITKKTSFACFYRFIGRNDGARPLLTNIKKID